jgi:hypothetical protein
LTKGYRLFRKTKWKQKKLFFIRIKPKSGYPLVKISSEPPCRPECISMPPVEEKGYVENAG